MLQKGLEVIEAHWLFNIPIEKIEIIIHPQSIIHSLVEFVDGSIKAQLGMPDMKIPIQYALSYPDHDSILWESLDLAKVKTLTFESPDLEKFPCIRLAYDAIKKGGSFPVVLNIANDEAVDLFLNNQIKFINIPEIIESAMKQHTYISNPNLNDIEDITNQTKKLIYSKLEKDYR